MIMGGGLVLMYVFSIITNFRENIENIKYASFFYYFDYTQALIGHEYNMISIMVFASVAAIATVIGLYWFNKRDIAVWKSYLYFYLFFYYLACLWVRPAPSKNRANKLMSGENALKSAKYVLALKVWIAVQGNAKTLAQILIKAGFANNRLNYIIWVIFGIINSCEQK